MNNVGKKTIIWLEDNTYEGRLIELADFIESRYNLRIAGGISSLKCELDDAHKNGEDIKGVILDLMIYGATDLSVFGLPNITWDKGYSHVGEMILKYVFRNIDDQQLVGLSKVSALLLTVKSDFNERNMKQYYGNVSVVKKYDESNENWIDGVKKWIDSL